MPPVKTRALILHGFAYGETSRILRLLTPEYGLRSVIAKGAQRPRSRFGAVLEPFTEGEAQFNLREGRDLFTLSGFSLLRSRQGIGRDLSAFAGASLIAEIALRASTEEPFPALYHALVTAFDRLNEPRAQHDGIALSALWQIVSQLGFQPEMKACVHCSRMILPEEQARFDVHLGGIACPRCAPHARPLDPLTRTEISRMSSGEVLVPRTGWARLHGALLREFLQIHVTPDRPLRSLPIFLEAMQ